MSAAKHTPTLRIAPGDAAFVRVEGIVKPINCGSAKTAAFIVRACNSHDALVAAIEKSVSTLQRIESDTVRLGPSVCAEVCADLRAALKAAKGET